MAATGTDMFINGTGATITGQMAIVSIVRIYVTTIQIAEGLNVIRDIALGGKKEHALAGSKQYMAMMYRHVSKNVRLDINS